MGKMDPAWIVLIIQNSSQSRSYFLIRLRVTPINVPKLVARTRYSISMLHTHTAQATTREAAEMSRPVEAEWVLIQQCRRIYNMRSGLVLRLENRSELIFQPRFVLVFG